MKNLRLCFCSAVILLIGVSCPAWSFLVAQSDSIDAQINRELDCIYDDLYFTNYEKATSEFDKQTEVAAQAGRWQLVISALTLKAKSASYHYLADKMYFAEARQIFEKLSRDDNGLYKEIAQWNIVLIYLKENENVLLESRLKEILNQKNHTYAAEAVSLSERL